MDKSCQSSGESSITTSSSSSNSNKDHYLKHLNKISHKISKPFIRKPPPPFDHHHPQNQNQNQNQNLHNHQPPPSQPPSLQHQQQQQQQQHQPPVYNINKSDFRDVVQKLTGSPAHERFSTPPPIHPPKPPSSRLQRFRPPPLSQISNRPPPLLNNAIPPPPPHNYTTAINPNNSINTTGATTSTNYTNIQRQVAPLSPLPPFPAVHAAAESPVSAYMRYLQSSVATVDSDPKRFSGFSPLAHLVSPRWSNPTPPPPPRPQQGILPSPTAMMNPSESQFFMPSSPLPFGCLPSPRSPYPLLSPGLLFSPTGQLGFPQFPLSPRVPVPSPRWRDL